MVGFNFLFKLYLAKNKYIIIIYNSMSINHILKDVVPDDEKLDVKFGIVEADNLEITTGTFENLIVDNLGVDSGAIIESLLVRTGLTVRCPLISEELIRTTETVEAKAHLFKSFPFLNSTTIGPNEAISGEQLVNGMLIFDDASKINFDYRMPYKIDLDTYLGFSGSEEYAFRFNVAIFATIPSGTTLRLTADGTPNNGVSFNFTGTYTKLLPHVAGEEDSYNFICVRQSDGNYIIYG